MAIFGGKAEAPPKPATARPDTDLAPRGSRLGRGLLIDGTVTGAEPLVIEGEVRGKIDLQGDLRVGSTAHVQATIHAKNVVVEGAVNGDLSSDGRLELAASARVEGNLRAPKVVVAEGAKFQGSIDMNAPRPEGKTPSAASTKPEDKNHASSSKQT